jgi:hypothetical protein
MFMGLRRHILGPTWTFLPEENLHLYQLLNEGEVTAIRKLPLEVSGTEREIRASFERQRRATRRVLFSSYPSSAHF